ncbi:hypothetical protein [uncultured Pedobacter sp.]|uniref:hypothetical protein n=1 Tax=uncultured Pedobacter sp. TaxID=246139 RepID=UPI002638CA17|nr:hypothetical protein [uncultured Pedobacter sp.]
MAVPQINYEPYKTIENQTYGHVQILVKKGPFVDVLYRNNYTTINFNNCSFTKVEIVAEEDVNFKDISVHFMKCQIDEITVEQITATNILVLFSGCSVNGRISSPLIKSVQCNNCLTRGLFLEGVESCSITYSPDNLDQEFWNTQIDAGVLNTEGNYYKMRYALTDCKVINISSRFDLKEKNLATIISLSYKDDGEDKKATLSDLHLYSLSIDGKPEGTISIENVAVQDMFLRDLSPKGSLTFFRIRPAKFNEQPNKIEIHRCNLENTWFDNVDLKSFLLSFYRTRFVKSIFTSCTLPSNYVTFENLRIMENIHYTESESDSFHKDRYEIFIQLKKNFEALGNYYEAQKLQAMAHEELKRIDSISWWDKRILKINSRSNQHGLSIAWPLFWFGVCSITLYLFYLWSMGRLYCGGEYDPQLFGYYFQFIDVTHRLDFLETDRSKISGLAMAIDFFNKIILGFLIYQFIAAFRKYGKV